MPPERSKNGVPYQEPERHDELSTGIAAPVSAGAPKRRGGRFAPDDAETKALAAKGGASHKGRTKLSHKIVGAKLSAASRANALALRKATVTELAATAGGGTCGVVPSLLAKFAAQKVAAAEEAFERGDYETHRKLSESARMDLIYCRELVAKDAKARGDANPTPAWFMPPEVRK